ncbi:hypothetical protein [Paraburkholderia sp. HD33-4]|uniref:hypothetical protein n=1 Tax=Paraburkholderia sp. HD33-4 TaxID=2883242 RepID=UPI001F2B8D18|nr:hypothetical protein [Paraburkholderia sp. HD33-4]
MNQNTFMLLLLPVLDGLKTVGASAGRAHQPATGKALRRVEGLRNGRWTQSIGGRIKATKAYAPGGRHREHDGARALRQRRFGVRLDIAMAFLDQRAREALDLTDDGDTRAVCMRKQSMERSVAFERFF